MRIGTHVAERAPFRSTVPIQEPLMFLPPLVVVATLPTFDANASTSTAATSSNELARLEAEPTPLALAYTAAPRAEHKTYLRVSGGLVTTTDSNGPSEDVEFDEGWMASLGLGKRLGASDTGLGFSLELDALWSQQDASTSGTLQAVNDVTAAGVLLDGILDFKIADQFSIYGGAGIGVAWLDVGTRSDALNDFDEEDGPFLAWTAKAGVQWKFGASTALMLGYRFLNIDDAEIDDDLGGASFDLQTEQHVAELGLVFGF